MWWAGVLRTLLILCLLLRVLLLLTLTILVVPSDWPAWHLEGVSVHFAWRWQAGEVIYPDFRAGPYVVHFMTPAYEWLVAQIAPEGGLLPLYWTGRGITVTAGLGTSLLLAGLVYRVQHSIGWALLAGLASWSVAPMFRFGITARPDVLAEFLGFAGFLFVVRPTTHWWHAVLAGMCLAAGFLTKQPAILFVVAAVVVLIRRGEYSAAGLVTVTTLAISASVLAWLWLGRGESHLWLNVFGERFVPWSLENGGRIIGRLLIVSPDLLLGSIALLWMEWKTRREEADRSLAILTVILLAWSLIGVFKEGADINYALSLRLSAGYALVRIFTEGQRRWQFAYLVGVAMSLFFAGSELADGAFRESLRTFPEGMRRLEEESSVMSLAEKPSLSLLTTDSEVAARQRERAWFVDGFLFRVLVESGVIDPSKLIEVIHRRELDFIILTSIPIPDDDNLFRLPSPVADAVRRSYRPLERKAQFFILGRDESNP